MEMNCSKQMSFCPINIFIDYGLHTKKFVSTRESNQQVEITGSGDYITMSRHRPQINNQEKYIASFFYNSDLTLY